MATIKLVLVLILVDVLLNEKQYKPGQVVELDATTAKSLEKSGQVDSEPAAVKHAVSQGAKPVKHVEPELEKPEGNGAPPSGTEQTSAQ